MRILLLTSSYPPVLGGLQTAAHSLARGLTQKGNAVQIVTNRYPRSLPQSELIDGVRVHRWLLMVPRWRDIPRGRPDLFLASLYFFPATLTRLTRLLRQFQPDVMNVHYPDAMLPFIRPLLKQRNFRLVTSLHGYEIERWFSHNGANVDAPAVPKESRADFCLLQSLLQESEAVTACSSHLLERAIKIEPSVRIRGCVIHNGIDLDRFEDSASYNHSRPYILAYGRLTYQKGFDLLLKAFANVAHLHSEVDLIVAGEGEKRTELKSLSQQLGIDGRTLFYGRATPQQVVRLLNGSLFAVVPSRWEAFGIVALEAMAAGKAVLATRVGGLPEFIPKELNLLVEPTAQALAAGMANWLDSISEIKMQAARNRQVAEQFTWDQVAQKYIKVFEGDRLSSDFSH